MYIVYLHMYLYTIRCILIYAYIYIYIYILYLWGIATWPTRRQDVRTQKNGRFSKARVLNLFQTLGLWILACVHFLGKQMVDFGLTQSDVYLDMMWDLRPWIWICREFKLWELTAAVRAIYYSMYIYIYIHTHIVGDDCKQHPTRQWHREKGVLERHPGSWNHAEQKKTRALISRGVLGTRRPSSVALRGFAERAGALRATIII